MSSSSDNAGGAGGALHAVVEGERTAEDVADRVGRIQRGVGELEDDLEAAELVLAAAAQIGGHLVAVEPDAAGMRGKQARDHACQRGLAAAGLADDPEVLAALERAADLADGDLGRQAVTAGRAVARDDVPHFEHRLAWRGLGRGDRGVGRRVEGREQLAGVGVSRGLEDGGCRALLLDLAAAEHDDAVGDLGDHGEVVRDIDAGHGAGAHHRLEGAQHLDLGGHVEGGGGLVEDH